MGGSRLPGRGTRPRRSGASTRRNRVPIKLCGWDPQCGRTWRHTCGECHGALGPALIVAVGETPLSPHSVGWKGANSVTCPFDARSSRPKTDQAPPDDCRLIRHQTERKRHRFVSSTFQQQDARVTSWNSSSNVKGQFTTSRGTFDVSLILFCNAIPDDQREARGAGCGL